VRFLCSVSNQIDMFGTYGSGTFSVLHIHCGVYSVQWVTPETLEATFLSPRQTFLVGLIYVLAFGQYLSLFTIERTTHCQVKLNIR
jgi:formate hydrogenlyase subunit 3/multisubunit Na+/H+ antiporter MnhD subunit